MDEARSVLRRLSSARGPSSTPKQLDAVIKQHVSAIGKLSQEARAAILADPVDLLQTLDPTLNTIGYLAVLDMLRSKKVQLSAQLRDMTQELLLKFDPCQVRYVGSMFLSLVERLGCSALFPPQVAVELLVAVMLRLDPSASIFTSTHLVLAKLASTTGFVEPARPVLDADILFYPVANGAKDAKPNLCNPNLPPYAYISPSTGLTEMPSSAMVLEYNVLRGMMYISRRDWARARAALEQVVTHPMKNKGVNKLMTNSHKKWLLVGLLHQGKASRLPPYTNSTAQANYQAMNEPYITLSGLYGAGQEAELRQCLETNRQTWEEDDNTSLIDEVKSAYLKWQIVNLRRIYQRLSMSELRRMTLGAENGDGPGDDQATLSLVQGMIESGMLCGEIQTDPEGGESYLAFGDGRSSMPETDFANEVARSQQSIERLSAQYQVVNERLSGNRDYARHLIREQRRVDMDKDADAAVGFETQIEDEDLMTGVMAHA
ncbi:hypothetical protein CDD83_2890 [Cordyceps sp. RAO-2017]|nr:hypothetical protein CDD83_2890 [Cordyceps sp. RAO-2017]